MRTSTIPPTRATGNMARCSQPRSRGLTAATRSAMAPAARSGCSAMRGVYLRNRKLGRCTSVVSPAAYLILGRWAPEYRWTRPVPGPVTDEARGDPVGWRDLVYGAYER